MKRRILGLHQDTKIGSVDITDTWEPLEEGLNRLETTRHVSVITITLSTEPLDPTSIGYQAPLEEEFVKPLQETTVAGRAGWRVAVAAFPSAGDPHAALGQQTWCLHFRNICRPPAVLTRTNAAV